jgi:hypothetical protein
MSRAYTSDGKRRSSQTHARRVRTCACGRKLRGNGGWSSHLRACYLGQMAKRSVEFAAHYGHEQ